MTPEESFWSNFTTGDAMTEYEWLTCDKPLLMLRRLRERDAATDGELHYLCRKKLGLSNVVIATESMGYVDKSSCDLIREVAGNPFRPIYHVKDYLNDPRASYHVQATAQTSTREHQELIKELNNRVFLPEWLTGDVYYFAANIVESGDYRDVDVLADLLEEAGCDNEELLRHFRQEVKDVCPCDHMETFGCWDCRNTGFLGWLPKPVPCQAGCWALRLLTEES